MFNMFSSRSSFLGFGSIHPAVSDISGPSIPFRIEHEVHAHRRGTDHAAVDVALNATHAVRGKGILTVRVGGLAAIEDLMDFVSFNSSSEALLAAGDIQCVYIYIYMRCTI